MERLKNLLQVLSAREKSTPGLAERIARVKNDIAKLEGKPEPKMEPKKDVPVVKKKKIMQEVEVDE